MYSNKSFSLHKFHIGISVFFVAVYLILIFCNYTNLTIFSCNETGSNNSNLNKATGSPKLDDKLIKAVKRGILSEHEALFYEKSIHE